MISLSNICKVYAGDTYKITALENITIDIHDGDFVSIMGRSGSGKTTLLNILGFLDKPTSGKFIYDDMDVSDLSMKKMWKLRRENIGFVFQNFALIENNTVFENTILPLQAVNVPRKQAIKMTNEILTSLGIYDLKKKYPGQISGGQKQRVAIARALIANPKMILADEPTGALDSETGNEIMDIFKEINKEGKTVVIVTHDEKISAKTKRRIRLEESKIVEDICL
jgi:hypothetical protein